MNLTASGKMLALEACCLGPNATESFSCLVRGWSHTCCRPLCGCPQYKKPWLVLLTEFCWGDVDENKHTWRGMSVQILARPKLVASRIKGSCNSNTCVTDLQKQGVTVAQNKQRAARSEDKQQTKQQLFLPASADPEQTQPAATRPSDATVTAAFGESVSPCAACDSFTASVYPPHGRKPSVQSGNYGDLLWKWSKWTPKPWGQ